MISLLDYQKKRRSQSLWLLLLYLALLFYGFGVQMLESFLNYPMWWDLGARMSNVDFIAVRQVHQWRIFPLLVIPLALRVPVSIALFWWRPAFIQVWMLVAILALQLIGWTSSVRIQIPIQLALTNQGFSNELFARLITTDIWFRVLPFVCEVWIGLLIVRLMLGLVYLSRSTSSIR
ncbi:hypothetical protein [Phormidesmis sp. 146-33]